MKYILKIHASGKYTEIDLGKSQYDSFKRASEVLSNGLAMEGKYEILVSNYLEFEKEILDHTAQLMVRNLYDYEDFFHVRMSFNRKLVNLLTSARLYVDQLYRHVKAAIPGEQTVKEDVERLFSIEYDKKLEYRFMEALRNYVQHRGIPVHLIGLNSSSDNSGEERQLIYSIELASLKEDLQGDDDFKKSVLKEIPDEVDLKMATRVYIEGISKVHCAARKLVEQSLKESRSIIDNARASYQKVYLDESVVLYAICLEKNNVVDSVPLILDWDDIRLKLTKRNSELVNLRNRYVTGKVKAHNPVNSDDGKKSGGLTA